MSAAVVVSALSVAATIKTLIDSNKGNIDKASKLSKDYIQRDSLISYTKTCRVEPITIVDERMMYQPYLADILQTANSIFAAYYLQALAIDSVVGDVSVLQRLDKFNPQRSAFLYSKEDFANGLPVYSRDIETASMESTDPYMMGGFQPRKTDTKDQPYKSVQDTNKPQKGMTSSADVKGLREVSNLAVGKIFEANFKYNDQEFSLPIAIRLAINSVDPTSLVHILGIGKDNKSAKERYHAWRAGDLEFFRDIVMAEDLIKAHRSTLMHDKSGIYSEIMKRRNINAVAAASSGELSVGTASAIVVISDVTRKELEYQIGGKLSDFKTRQRVFDDCYLMLLFVVDTEFEHVTIYHRGIALATDMSLKEVKMASKGDGPNVTDILKAYISGSAPSF